MASKAFVRPRNPYQVSLPYSQKNIPVTRPTGISSLKELKWPEQNKWPEKGNPYRTIEGLPCKLYSIRRVHSKLTLDNGGAQLEGPASCTPAYGAG